MSDLDRGDSLGLRRRSGAYRGRLLVPPGLVESLPNEQLRWALLHELVHIRRGDTWVLLIQRLTQIVFFFHPAVWLANRLAGTFREFACDDAALALTGIDRRDCGGFPRHHRAPAGCHPALP